MKTKSQITFTDKSDRERIDLIAILKIAHEKASSMLVQKYNKSVPIEAFNALDNIADASKFFREDFK